MKSFNLINLILFIVFIGCKKESPIILPSTIEGDEIFDSIGFYSVEDVDGAVYEWTINNDFEIIQGQGTWSIQVKAKRSFAEGEICVKVKNVNEEKRFCKNIKYEGYVLQSFSIPIAGRKSPFLAAVNNELYFGLGSNASINYFNFTGDHNKIYKINYPDFNSPVLSSVFPQNLKRSSPVYFNYGTKIYVGFGTNQNLAYYNDLWEYDVSSQTWTQKASNPNLSVELASFFVINNKAHIVGGRNATQFNGTINHWEYDILSNTWNQLNPFPGGIRFDATGISDGANGYLIAGTDNISVLSDVWKFDSSTGNWSSITTFPGSARSGSFGFKIGDHLYFGSGMDYLGYLYQDFWKFDLVTLSWTRLPDLPFGICHTSTTTLNNSAILFGGRISINFAVSLSNNIYEIKF